MEIILTILYTCIFIFLIIRLPFFKLYGISKKAIPAVFIIKILAGIIMYFIYTKFYTDRATADIFKYFDDSKIMFDALWDKPGDFLRMLTGIGNDAPHFAKYYNQMNYWFRVYESNIYNDSHTIIRFNAFLRFFSFGYYNVHTVFMCFISITGLTGIYRFFEVFVQDKRKGLFFGVFLMPSVLFWGSGVLKEGLLLFGLGMLIWHLNLIIRSRKFKTSMFFVLVSIILLTYTKFYIIIALTPLLISHIWCELSGNIRCLFKYSIVIIISLVIGLNIHYIFPQYNFIEILVQKQNDFINLANFVNSGSIVKMEPLSASIWDLIINSPAALYNTMFRPWFFESSSLLMIIAGLENLIIIAILLCSIFFMRKKLATSSYFWFCFFFFIEIYLLTGLTTPVIGAIVRYKVPALPFLVIFLLYFIDKNKINKILPKLFQNKLL